MCLWDLLGVGHPPPKSWQVWRPEGPKAQRSLEAGSPGVKQKLSWVSSIYG